MSTDCPRARYTGKKSANFRVALDPALIFVARVIVAGVDKKYYLHPHFKSMAKSLGDARAQNYVVDVVKPGGGDVIQTEMDMGGCGLFGANSEEGHKFIFYEWTTPTPRFRICLSKQDARDILSGKKKTFRCIMCTKAHFSRRKRTVRKYYVRARKKNK